MALDIKKLKSLQKDIKKKSGEGDNIFLYAGKLPEELDVRILPPLTKMNGVYFVEEEGWWVNGKFVLIDPDNDVIKAEIDSAKATKDETLLALIDRKERGMKVLKKEVRYLIPLLVLDTKYNEDEELESCEVREARVLVGKPTQMKEINKIVTARPFQNGTEDGVADREKGFNIIIGKTGTGKNTEYYAMGWNTPMEMPEEWYKEDKIPDVMDLHEKMMKSETYQRSVIRNYLYGEEIIEDVKEDSKEDKKPAPKPAGRPAPKKAGTTARPKRGEKKVDKSQTKKRSLLDDAMNDINDLD